MSIPPPPPILPVFNNNEGQVARDSDKNRKQSVEDDIKDIFQKILKGIKSNKSSFVFNYRFLCPILQDGPNCGLAALSMATSCWSEMLNVNEIFKYTKSRGYSNNGEMFSVEYMAEIAKTLIGCEVEILDKGLENQEYVLNQIMNGALLLIPYDADFNHSPCKRKGHRAHWAVVSGLILEGLPPEESLGKCHKSNSKFNCIQYLPDEDIFVLQNFCDVYNSKKVYLLARQGKSLHPGVWSYKDLKDSNENLVEFDPSRAESDMYYILPPDGVEGGLKGKAILLKGLEPITADEILKYFNILKTLM